MTLEYGDPAAVTFAQADQPCADHPPEGDPARPTGRAPRPGTDRSPIGRAALSLDGEWAFRFFGDAGFAHGEAGPPWRTCVVPGPWQARFADLRERNGRALYRREFDLPPGWPGPSSALVLRFGAVGYHACVRVNGRVAVEHEGGYLPFEAEIGGLVRPGRNEVAVEVTAPTDDPDAYPEFPLSEIPFGKQSWYGPLGGIWQSVTLERRSADHVRSVQALPDLRDGRVEVSVALARPVEAGGELGLDVEGPGGSVVASRTATVGTGAQLVTTTISVADPLPWSPNHPNLYRLTVALRDADGEALDAVAETFGFRTIEARDGRIHLNGEPVYLRGALDQDYYPDGICTVPSEAFLEDQFRKAKALGLNCVRCHIKVPDPRYYAVADRVGLLVWTELPNVGRLTDRAAERLEETFQGIFERDGNHPSIICWTIINENWGTDLLNDDGHRAWLGRTYRWLKALDPTRLVVDNSPCPPNIHVETDLNDWHFYAAIPDHRQTWDRFVEGYAASPAWTHSTAGDAVRTGREPLVCSEFGNWGLPDPALLKDADGAEPWWFETGHDWADGVMYPHGIEYRFAALGLAEVFGSLRGFALAAQWQQYRALKYQIEAMRRAPALAGYVITELTDCHWEANGLLDMRRNPRVFHDSFAAVNADTVVVPRWDRVAYWEGEPVEVGLCAAHGRATAHPGSELRWRLDGDGPAGGGPVDVAHGVTAAGPAAFRAPEVKAPAVRRLGLELAAAGGEVLATNHVDLAIHPGRRGPPAGPCAVWAADPGLAERFSALGYRAAASADAADVVAVRGALDGRLLTVVRGGARLVLLADQPQDLQPVYPQWLGIRVVHRMGTPWLGAWASSFSWLRRHGPFARLPGGPLLDHAFDRVIPDHVIVGMNAWTFRSGVHAGMVVGWIHKPAALLVEQPYGRGLVVATTFRLLEDAPGADPTATALLDGLVELALKGRPAPTPAPGSAAIPEPASDPVLVPA